MTRTAAWRPTLLGTATVIQLLTGGHAGAIDILPRDYYPLPSGTTASVLYYDFNRSNKLNIAGGGTFKENTNLQVNVGVYRQVYYGDLDGRSWGAQMIIPFGTETGEISGDKLSQASGLGDIMFAVGTSFLPHPDPTRNIGIVLYVSAPTGSYSPTQTLNLGTNRWSFDPQIGYTQAIGDKFWLDVAVDLIAYTENHNVGPNSATLHQQPTFQGQLWFSYVPDIASLLSVGYAGQTGGAKSIYGVNTGVKTESQQVRLAYLRFLTPRFQVAGSVARDASVSGGFQRSVEVLLRAAYLF